MHRNKFNLPSLPNLLSRAALALALCAWGSMPAKAQEPGQTATKPKGMSYEAAEALVKSHLATFDDLDYNVFSGQKWAELHRSHAQDVLVHWPDGHTTKGIEKHIEDLKAMFVYAPDTRIKVHTLKMGQGEWTAVMGMMEGTFTQPMPVGEGKTLAPTGKAYKIGMATLAHWNKNGAMDEEYLFWDNMTFMNQLGLGK